MEPTASIAPPPANLTSRLIHGDCLEVMPTLAPSSVAMVFADLPYGIIEATWDQRLCLKALWTQLSSLSQPNAVCVLTATQPFASDLIASNRKFFRYDIVWARTKCTGMFHVKKRPMRKHDNILIFSHGKYTYHSQRVPSGKKNTKSLVRRGSEFARKRNVYTYDGSGLQHPTSLLKVDESDILSRVSPRVHPTQKPVALLEWLIKTYTNPGDTVLDPVAGSGTTAIAALRTGRHSICIEKDPAYFAVMQKRVADERAKLGLEAI